MSSKWERAAKNQAARAERLQRKVEILEHAMNLYINDSVSWVSEVDDISTEGQVTKQRFGIGVARNCPITDQVRSVILGKQMEDVYVILWRTEFLGGQFMTAYSWDELKRMPSELTGAGPEAEKLRRVVEGTLPILEKEVSQLRNKRQGEETIH